ncbi:onanonoxo-7-onima-8-eninoihtemlysoneda [Infundibulicybe gibba]|nr:onanonoxo-7-onima-8-eninoihtemlysoneda [Infundibulicybe gibba]
MSLLFKHLRVHQIFGANTDVGKTILTSALVRASASKDNNVFYLKPVSTGPIQDADDRHCLYRFDEPVSPHLAAILAGEGKKQEVPSDKTFVDSIASYISRCASQSARKSHMFVETAGGVHSPTLSGTTQVDAYRPLFLPTILIGDSKLGGISTTLSSYESLLLRGYIIDAIVLFRDEYYRNWEYLTPYFAERGIRVSAVDPPPPKHTNDTENSLLTEAYYKSVVAQEDNGVSSLVDHLDTCHANRLQELDSMPRRTLDTIWWPFVQHGLVNGEKDVTVIDSAHSDFFSIRKPPSSIGNSTAGQLSLLAPEHDGSASWWTQTLGHAHTPLTLAAARASGRYGHVMFPQATHLPALKLAERLVHDGPGKGWASRAFFSDNGSTAMEVALKMALRAYSMKNQSELGGADKSALGILGLKGSYHGDTIGAMDACEEGVYSCEWHSAKGYWFDPPTIAIQQGKVVISVPPAIVSATELEPSALEAPSLSWAYNVPARLQSPLARAYREFITLSLEKLEKSNRPKLAALVLEPLVMGAGGMLFVDPLFQRVLIDVVRGESNRDPSQWSGLPVIFDEVFVGLYRIGMESTGPLLGVTPDISVNAKILTGGLIPMAITLASDSIFKAFLSNEKAMHFFMSGSVWSFWDPGFIQTISHMDSVQEIMTLGSVLAIKIKDDHAGYVSHSARNLFQPLSEATGDASSCAPGGAPFSVHFRTLGNVAYFITSLNTPPTVIRSLEDKIWTTLQK